MKKSPFNYTDYRKFLADFFDAAKSSGTKLTYEKICAEAGIKSPGHLSLILSGKARISGDLAKRFAALCSLKKRETQYFLSMVRFNQEKSNSEKLHFFEELISYRESSIYRVGPHLYKYYSRWYYSVVRALVEFMHIKDNFEELARTVVPAIRPDQAAGAVRLLAELDLIAPDEKGFWRPTQKSIDSGSTTASAMVNNFMLSMLDRARESMDRFERDERIFSAVTLGVDRAGYEQIVTELREFRRKAAQIARQCKSDRVVQVNFQVFPVSKVAQDNGGNNV
jgi:uncharacterized protein (TIGR02147 family)